MTIFTPQIGCVDFCCRLPPWTLPKGNASWFTPRKSTFFKSRDTAVGIASEINQSSLCPTPAHVGSAQTHIAVGRHAVLRQLVSQIAGAGGPSGEEQSEKIPETPKLTQPVHTRSALLESSCAFLENSWHCLARWMLNFIIQACSTISHPHPSPMQAFHPMSQLWMKVKRFKQMFCNDVEVKRPTLPPTAFSFH